MKKTPRLPAPELDGRRAELVEAAYALIAEKGLEGLRTRDIAAKVGINISTLHYHFETKEKLIAAVVDHVHVLFRTVRAPLRAGASSLDALRSLFESQAHRRRAQPELEIVLNELLVRARRDADVRAAVEEMLVTFRDIAEQLVSRCIADRFLRDDVDAKTVAGAVTALLMGTTMGVGLRPSPSMSSLTDLFLDQLLARG